MLSHRLGPPHLSSAPIYKMPPTPAQGPLQPAVGFQHGLGGGLGSTLSPEGDPHLGSQGGVKVLITGPWQEAGSNYSCLFDSASVPASLIQPGVLRCYCPGEGPGCGGLTLGHGPAARRQDKIP